MDTTTNFGQAGAANSGLSGTGTNAGTDGTSSGNDQLSAAFDRAIAEAQRTLETTTIKGADLYALKQNAR